MRPAAGYRERAHTADWELEAWAPDLPGLFEQAARGMYALSGLEVVPGAEQARSIELQGVDAESLLVRYLTELLWYIQEEWIGFERFSIKIDHGLTLQAQMWGKTISALEKEIKAVTYHNLEIVNTNQGVQAVIVFDV